MSVTSEVLLKNRLLAQLSSVSSLANAGGWGGALQKSSVPCCFSQKDRGQHATF